MTRSTDPRGGPRHRVLLVDDDPTMLRLMASLLGVEMDVVTCSSGAQALHVLEQRTFDVICSDYRMPGMTGIDLLRAASQLQEDASCLLVTAAAEQVPGGDRRQYFVVVKPFDADRFVRLVEQLARVSQMKRSVKSAAARPAPSAERDSRPPPSGRPSEPPSQQRFAPPSERRSSPPSEPRSSPTSSVPRSAGLPRSTGGGRK